MKALFQLFVLISCTLSAQAKITGQWNFENGDLSASIGNALTYRGDTANKTRFGTTTSFGIADINGEPTHVMCFPATTPTEGFILSHGAEANGGGVMANQYTIIMDVLFPSSSTGYRSFWQTDTGSTSDGDLFVNGGNGIGISGIYNGSLTPDVWHRVAFTFDLTKRELGKFIDGTNVLTAPVGAAPLGMNNMQYLDSTTGVVDGRWALGPEVLLFADDDNETGLGYVSSIQFHNRTLAPSEIAALGSPNAAKIPIIVSSSLVQWDFDGNLASSTGGANLVADSTAPATSPEVTFTNVSINGQMAQVAHFSRGTFFRMTHGLAPNNEGNNVNQYTLIMDVMFPSRPTGWASLWQTDTNNTTDGDWFINPTGGLGISGIYGGNLADGQWCRLALVVDSHAGTLTSFLNGTQVQQMSGVSLDDRWTLGPTVLLFADENEENAAGYINSVQLQNILMSAADIAQLGGAQASGIPISQQSSDLQVLTPNGGENLTAGSTQTITWQVSNPSGLVQIDLLIAGSFYRNLGKALMSQSNFSWTIDSGLGDTNNYQIHISSVDFPTVEDNSDYFFSITGCGKQPNFSFDKNVVQNGGFESGLTNWQVIMGNPAVLDNTDGKGSPCTGDHFLYGGLKATTNMIVRQDIDLIAFGFSAKELDSGAALKASAWMRNGYGGSTFDNQTYLRIAFLDSANQELNTARTLIPDNVAWTKRTVSAMVPTGTRALRVEVIGLHRRDQDNDCFADEITATLEQASPSLNPTITKLPMLQDYRQNAMTLLWETDGNQASHAVDWGRSNINENTETHIDTIQIDTSHFVHFATLTNLSPETHYTYRVRSGNTHSASYTFRTAPLHDTPFSVAWWGDSQVGPTVLEQMIPSMIAHQVDLLAVAGDLVSSGVSLSDWENYWFSALEFDNIAQTRPALFARGNHDAEYAYCYAYSALPENGAWYAFNYGNSRFIFLDTEAPTTTSPEQYSWLTNELTSTETQNAEFRIVCFHRLPFSNLWDGGGYIGEEWVRNDWVPLFQKYHVDMVINGHSHCYDRGQTNGVTYIVTGGGGGGLDTQVVAQWPVFTVQYSRFHYDLMQINGNNLSWTTFANTGETLDSFALRSRIPHLSVASTSPTPSWVLNGKLGETYILETSTDLIHWTPFRTNTLIKATTVTSPLQMDATQRFIRSRIVDN